MRTSLCLPSSKSQRAGYAALPGTSQLDNDKMLACIHATQQHALRLIFTINGPATRTSVRCMVSDASTKQCQLCRHVRYLRKASKQHKAIPLYTTRGFRTAGRLCRPGSNGGAALPNLLLQALAHLQGPRGKEPHLG